VTDEAVTATKPTVSSINDFCQRWDIGRSTFYEWMAAGKAPRVLKVGPKRRVITAADEAAWVAAREAEAE
jgi:predicted DNA-binding transcriptional regulator AlpA